MLIEFGDFSDFGEVYVRYYGNRALSGDEVLARAARADTDGALGASRCPELIHDYEIPEEEREHGYPEAHCWVFRVLPPSQVPVAAVEHGRS